MVRAIVFLLVARNSGCAPGSQAQAQAQVLARGGGGSCCNSLRREPCETGWAKAAWLQDWGLQKSSTTHKQACYICISEAIVRSMQIMAAMGAGCRLVLAPSLALTSDLAFHSNCADWAALPLYDS